MYTGPVALAGETARGIRVRLDLFCFFVSRQKRKEDLIYKSIKQKIYLLSFIVTFLLAQKSKDSILLLSHKPTIEGIFIFPYLDVQQCLIWSINFALLHLFFAQNLGG